MKRFALLLSVFAAALTVTAQPLRIDDVDPEDLEIKGFTLTSNTTVNIKGTGGVFRDDYRMLVYYGWILDADTRKVKWHLFDEFKGRRFMDEDGFYNFNIDVDLSAGNYELYFSAAYNNLGWGDGDWTFNSFGDLIEEIFDSRAKEKFHWSMKDDLYIEVAAPGMEEADPETFLNKKLSEAAIYFIKARNNERFDDGFTIKDETTIGIYSIGEGRREETFDYLWINEAGSGKQVFEMNYRNTSFAGGAEKNLKIDEEITLPAGSYQVSYVTDDSHSWGGWNALPPDDPQFWGVTITPASEKDKNHFVPYDPPKTVIPVLEIVRVRDDELKSKGFSLLAESKLRVLCLGEGSSYDDMADYGWIVDANTRETVWRMKSYRSEHAGGANKNRRVEETITLPTGDYIAYYSTDGSHSYHDWNAARPYEEDRWGITIWASEDTDLDNIKVFDARDFKAKKVIAEILMVEDNEYYREYFTLDKETKVSVIAMGEGRDGRMFDFGWIKNMDTGQIVWEMDYYDTEHAGGARKNRISTGILTLPAGEYGAYYETDGSHSFERWNDDPPREPQSYGIRLLKVD